MKLCRYGPDRVGVIRGDVVHDVSAIAEKLPRHGWPYPSGDQLIAHLDELRAEIGKLADRAKPRPLSGVDLLAPVANPGKVVVAGTNYEDHIAEAAKDQTIAHGRQVNRTLEEKGVFLKATSSIVRSELRVTRNGLQLTTRKPGNRSPTCNVIRSSSST